nr:MAG TPA: hypothetical protein [Caudoviricetes sp.]
MVSIRISPRLGEGEYMTVKQIQCLLEYLGYDPRDNLGEGGKIR